MAVISTVVVKVDMTDRRLCEGETLFGYARRILREEGIDGAIFRVDTNVCIVDVTTCGSKMPETAGGPETMTIEVRPQWEVR